MKKISIIIMISVLLISMFFGCGVQRADPLPTDEAMLGLVQTDLENVSIEAIDSAAEASSDVLPPEPPCILHLRGLNSYSELVAAQNLSEDDLLDFLQENLYYYNGIETADDVHDFCEKLANIPLPLLADAQLNAILVYPDCDRLDAFYAFDSETRLVYTFEMEENSAEILNEKIAARTNITEKIDANNINSIYYYEAKSSRTLVPYPRYIADLNGHYAVFMTYGFTRTTAEVLLSTISFDTVANLSASEISTP